MAIKLKFYFFYKSIRRIEPNLEGHFYHIPNPSESFNQKQKLGKTEQKGNEKSIYSYIFK